MVDGAGRRTGVDAGWENKGGTKIPRPLSELGDGFDMGIKRCEC